MLTAQELPLDELKTFDAIVLGPLYYNDFHPDLIKNLSKINPTIFLAPQGLIRHKYKVKIILKKPEAVLKVIPYVSYLSLDEAELLFITSQPDMISGAYTLRQHGLNNFIVTQGQHGSLICLEGKIHPIPAFHPKAITDPTGAGDSYLAGFIAAKNLYKLPTHQGHFAAMTATMAIEKNGPFSGSVKEVKARLTTSRPSLSPAHP